MEINLVEIWGHMGWPVRCVVMLLLIQALASCAVVIDRVIMLVVARGRSMRFAVSAATLGKRPDPIALLALARRNEKESSHLSSFVETGVRTFIEFHQELPCDRALDQARRTLERQAEALSRQLFRYTNVLASTGSTAPFVGLLGTVLGILNAFKMIAATGSGGMGAIGGAIGEALIVTGVGLTVAIPTVLVFNWLSGQLGAYEADVVSSANDVIDRLELSGDELISQQGRTWGGEAFGPPTLAKV